MSKWVCGTCPFTTDDPQAVDGHENHAPERGWLGQHEQHKMGPETVYGRMSPFTRRALARELPGKVLG